MDLSAVEQLILDRFAEKCRAAGGPRPGYMLRRGAFRRLEEGDPGLDVDGGLARLVERGVLEVNDGGGLFFLTEEGVSSLSGA